MLEKTFNYYKQYQHDTHNLFIIGNFDDELTQELLNNNEKSSTDKKAIKKRLSFLIAECFQNIIRHSDDNENIDELYPKLFALRSLNQISYITTTNIVNKDKQAELDKTLTELGTLDSDQLKARYLEILDQNEFTERGGGGLGLIEMARKSKKAPYFLFDSINDELSNFFMGLEIIPKGIEETNPDLKFNQNLDFYKDVVKNKIILCKKGDFSNDTVMPIFQLFESTLKGGESSLGKQKILLYVLIELLQNVSKHAQIIDESREGIVLINHDGDSFQVCTGNFIKPEEKENIASKIDQVNQRDEKELKNLYKLVIRKKIPAGQSAGLGLIDMKRHSKNPIDYKFDDLENGLSFFTIKVNI